MGSRACHAGLSYYLRPNKRKGGGAKKICGTKKIINVSPSSHVLIRVASKRDRTKKTASMIDSETPNSVVQKRGKSASREDAKKRGSR